MGKTWEKQRETQRRKEEILYSAQVLDPLAQDSKGSKTNLISLTVNQH